MLQYILYMEMVNILIDVEIHAFIVIPHYNTQEITFAGQSSSIYPKVGLRKTEMSDIMA